MRKQSNRSGRMNVLSALENDLELCVEGFDELIERQRRLGNRKDEASEVESRSIEVKRDSIRDQAEIIRAIYERIMQR